MKRRTAIRNVVLVSAGAAVLYSCTDKPASITLRNIPITRAEEDLLTELTETIIPGTDFPGATDLKTTEFILTMADDCFGPEEQQKFIAGMKAFDKAGFINLSAEKKKEFLSSIDGDAKTFYQMVKQGTILNFTSSKEYLEKVKNITTLIPPKFKACAPVVNS